MANLDVQLHGCRLTTAQIYYHFPDYPKLLQEFLWQDYDLAPQYPRLNAFLNFWRKDIEGTLHSVYIAKQPLIAPGHFTNALFDTHIE